MYVSGVVNDEVKLYSLDVVLHNSQDHTRDQWQYIINHFIVLAHTHVPSLKLKQMASSSIHAVLCK